jgi:CRISPR-associated exonuclease Cas4
METRGSNRADGETGMETSLDRIPLSYINQWAYCPRRFWYMFVYGEMSYNSHVQRGVINHEQVHTPGYATTQTDVVARRSVAVYSDTLGISGVCDLVEEHGDGEWVPVEYKQGRRGQWMNDHAQLCAQALCLEEMTGKTIARGALFYFGDRRREEVILTPELRATTRALIHAMRYALALGELPPHTDQPARCKGCSLVDICLPTETRLLQSMAHE